MIQTSDMIPIVQHVEGFEPTIIESNSVSSASASEEYTRRRKQLVDAFGNKKSKQILFEHFGEYSALISPHLWLSKSLLWLLEYMLLQAHLCQAMSHQNSV